MTRKPARRKRKAPPKKRGRKPGCEHTPGSGKPKWSGMMRLFVDHYLLHFEPARAAREAGYSVKVASATAQGLLRKPHVREEIEKRRRVVEDKIAVSADAIFQEYARIGFSDIRQVVSWDKETVTVRPSAELTAIDAASIAEITTDGKKIRVKMHPKVAALDSLARLFGMVPDPGTTSSNLIPKTTIEGRATEMSRTEIARRIAFALAQSASAAEPVIDGSLFD